MAAIEALVAACARLGPRAPRPLAHLRIATGGRTRDLLLADRTALDEGLTILDWQRAPLAELYLSAAEGEAYSIVVDGRELEGVLLERSTLGWEGAALRTIATDEALLAREGAEWRARPRAPRTMPRRPDALRRALLSSIRLDPAQQAAVTAPESEHLLVLGDAGHGKTTVALHRVAHLAAAARAARRPFRALVIVPGPGLRALCREILDHLEVEGVEVETAAAWIEAEARRIYHDLPLRQSGEREEVTRLKRHPALLEVLPAVIAGTPAMRDLKIDPSTMSSARERLLHLFGDRDLMDRVIAGSQGVLGRRERDAVLSRTRLQFSPTTEQAYAHVDAERRKTVDGRRIDDGTPDADADTLDAEDFAVVLELGRLAARPDPARDHLGDAARPERDPAGPERAPAGHGRAPAATGRDPRGSDRTGAPAAGRDPAARGRLRRYDHLVIDEAQELAPIEARVLGRALRPGASLTVAGDAEQQVDEAAYFTTWPDRMRDLGAPGHTQVALEVSYRCPPAVAAFARGVALRGPRVARSELAGDPAIGLARSPHAAALHLELVEALALVRADDPRATVAIVCRHEPHARALHQSLTRGLPARFVGPGDVDLRPGVVVTTVRAVKGLEFDLVILPDLEPAIYPDEPRSRRALYVAATRASAALWLCTPGAWSPLV
ncbi:MAG: AAA family ATPase [Nannocystaceae bacterium]